MEACDIFTSSREFVHVKAKAGGSKSFSHLFAQGGNAAEAFLADPSFRKKLRAYVNGQSAKLARQIPLKAPRASRFTVVFAIIGNYGNSIARELPFLSQVTLAHTAEGLRRSGFKVGITSIARQ